MTKQTIKGKLAELPNKKGHYTLICTNGLFYVPYGMLSAFRQYWAVSEGEEGRDWTIKAIWSEYLKDFTTDKSEIEHAILGDSEQYTF